MKIQGPVTARLLSFVASAVFMAGWATFVAGIAVVLLKNSSSLSPYAVELTVVPLLSVVGVKAVTQLIHLWTDSVAATRSGAITKLAASQTARLRRVLFLMSAELSAASWRRPRSPDA